MAKVTLLEEQPQPPYASLELTRAEFDALHQVIGEIGGGYGKALELRCIDTKGDLRKALNAVWSALDNSQEDEPF